VAAITCAGILSGTSRAGVVFDQHATTSATNLKYTVDPSDGTFHTAIGTDLNNNQIPNGTPVVSIVTDKQLKVGGQGQADISTLVEGEAFGKITITPSQYFDGFFVIGFNAEGAGNQLPQTTITATVTAYLNGSSTPTAPADNISTFQFGNNGSNWIRRPPVGRLHLDAGLDDQSCKR
jgi:hypothetical protein